MCAVCGECCLTHYAHHQEIQLRSTAYSCLSCCSCCDAGELGGKMWNAVGSPDDGHKDARNMLR